MSMTILEAIKRFEDQLTAAMAVLDSGFGTRPGESDRLYRERKEMAEIALQALREQEGRWIPVTEQLPKTDGRFMVTIKGRSGKPHVEMRNFHAGSQKWENQCGWLADENILAWQQRPRPYGWNPRKPEKEK